MTDSQTSFRVGIIGHTGRGDYGHYLDRAFEGVEGTHVVAVSDPDPAGRAEAIQLTGAEHGYADYREMLETEQPDIAVVASREIGDHLETVLEAAESGAHIYLEKPAAASPAEVDQMIAACETKGLLLIVAHPWRGHPPIQDVAIPLIKNGKIGEPRLVRMFGMGGPHGGDQLFLDLYPHFFDLLWQLFGPPAWCHAHITQDGRSVTPADLKPGVEGMGLVAGNGIKAYYQFADCAADFESYQGDGKEIPYRVDVHGTAGTISLPGPMMNEPDIYYHPLVNPRLMNDSRWEVIPADPPPDDHKWVNAHHRMARSMVKILRGEEPECDLVQGPNARLYLEMAMMAHASHIAGARVNLPLETAANPFDEWVA
jgi:predicted dehydrogenase